MRLITLNAHSTPGEAKAFADAVTRLCPDIIALQEVNQGKNASVCVEEEGIISRGIPLKEDNFALCAVRELKQKGWMYHLVWLGIKSGYDRYDEGLAFLCRCPIKETDTVLLSKENDYNNWRCRMALGIRIGDEWFYNLHTGRWEDQEEPFLSQWNNLQKRRKQGFRNWLMGDFNAPAEQRNKGYDKVLSDGWKDTRHLAEKKAGKFTVPGSIDGWEDADDESGMRMDFIMVDKDVPIKESAVVFDGIREEVLSDHFGVMVTLGTERGAGILLPVTALPSPYGIGCFSKEAYRFVDWLKEAGQSYWQILPLGPTGFGDSPYQSFSTFAGNPHMIDLEALIEEGLLTKEECEKTDFGKDKSSVSYEKLYQNRFPLLKRAFYRYQPDETFYTFREEQKFWLEEYAFFMAIKGAFEDCSLSALPEPIRKRDKTTLKKYKEELGGDIAFWEFLQYLFYQQWHKLKTYANQKGIQIIGDLPIYVSADSSDVWTNPELFSVDDGCIPVEVAGCPPDGFSAEGQLWGNPVFQWKEHQRTGYAWWLKRLEHCFSMYDIVRIDHFRGFDAFYTIPYGSKNAVDGVWKDAPGKEFFRKVRKVFPQGKIIAEDLGFVTDSVKELLSDCGFPGMKVLQFAFDARDTGVSNEYLPHKYPKNCVAYTGTHDNPTLQGWFGQIAEAERNNVRKYLCDGYTPKEKLNNGLIALLLRSGADTCIIPMQDYLGLGDNARMNTPSTANGNWRWRVTEEQLSLTLAGEIADTARRYGR